jgi:tetratricopeptide (TPR) repeat protein
MTDKFILEVSLEAFPFPGVLQNLSERGFTGRVVLRRGDVTKVVFLVEGAAVNVDSTLRDETLGRYLVKTGRITDRDYNRSIQAMMAQNIQQGAALVKLGCLSPKDLYHEVKAQTREKLVNCFGWTSGDLGCFQEIEFVADIYRFEMPTPAVMHEGIVRFFPPGAAEIQLARVSPEPIGFTPVFAGRIAEYELSRPERDLLEAIDGVRDLKALKAAMSSSPMAGKLLYLLLLTGLIGPGGRPEEALRSLGSADQALPAIEDFLLPSPETAPEAVVEEMLPEEDGAFALETPASAPSEDRDLAVPAAAAAAPEPPPAAGRAPSSDLIVEEEEVFEDEVMSESDIFAAPRKPAEKAALMAAEEPLPAAADEEEEEEEGEPAPDEHYRDESEILEAYMDIKSKNFFALLKVLPTAGDAEVEAAYRGLFARFDWGNYSPDISIEVMAKLEEIHTQIIRAYESLRTRQNREAYIKRLKEETPPGPMKDKLAAEQFLKKGLEFVRKREWPRAQLMFEQAVQTNPREPEFKGYLGWTIYSNPNLDLDGRRDRAKKILHEAIALNPQMDTAHVFLAKILKEEGKPSEAMEEFRTALRCNPRCKEAERELNAHQAGEW